MAKVLCLTKVICSECNQNEKNMATRNLNRFGHDKSNLYQGECDQREKSWSGQIGTGLDITKIICIQLSVISVKNHGQDKSEQVWT